MTSPSELLGQYSLAPEGSTKTSHSEIELYTKCQRAHYYAYGLRLRSKGMSDALARGLLGHAGLAAYYSALKENADLETATRVGLDAIFAGIEGFSIDDLINIIAEVRMLFRQYVEKWGESDTHLEILAVEQEFNIPVGPDYYIKMIVDLIVRAANSGIEVWDHKFVYDFFDPAVEKVIPQLPKYAGALRSVGIPVNGCRYNEIRYRNTKAIQDNPSLRFARPKLDVGSTRIIRTLQEQIRAAKQIEFLRGQGLEEWSNRVLRAANSNICRNCPFLSICAADLEGQDTTLIQQFDFDKRESDLNG